MNEFLINDSPRLLAAILAGIALSLSGSLTQLSLRNPLASPSTLGLDAIAVVISLLSLIMVQQFHWNFAGASQLVTLLILLLILGFIPFMYKKLLIKKISLHHYLLIGLALNLILGAFFSFYQFLSQALMFDFPSHLWFGNFRQASFIKVIIFIVALSACWLHLLRWQKSLIAIGIAGDLARNVSLDFNAITIRSLIMSLVLTILVVNFFGVFSFLSLIFPHLLRRLTRYYADPLGELTWGPWISGFFLMGLDQLCYHYLFQGAEVPAGMVATLIGSIALFVIMLAMHRKA